MADIDTRIKPDGEDSEGGDHTPQKDDQKGDGDKGQQENQQQDEDIIPVRRSTIANMQHIIARKDRQIGKIQKKNSQDDESAGGDDESAGGDIDEKINQAISQRMGPLQEHLLNRADEDELQDLYRAEPESKEMDKQIRAYMNFTAKDGSKPYANVPPSVIYHHLAFSGIQTKVTKQRDGADRAAAHGRSTGHSRRPSGASSDIPDVTDMTDEQMRKLNSDVMSGKFS